MPHYDQSDAVLKADEENIQKSISVQNHAQRDQASYMTADRGPGNPFVLGSARRDPGQHGVAGLSSA
jgi:hypothetical protein